MKILTDIEAYQRVDTAELMAALDSLRDSILIVLPHVDASHSSLIRAYITKSEIYYRAVQKRGYGNARMLHTLENMRQAVEALH